MKVELYHLESMPLYLQTIWDQGFPGCQNTDPTFLQASLDCYSMTFYVHKGKSLPGPKSIWDIVSVYRESQEMDKALEIICEYKDLNEVLALATT